MKWSSLISINRKSDSVTKFPQIWSRSRWRRCRAASWRTRLRSSRCRFHQHFISSIYMQRFQKRKNTLVTWLPFCNLGICLHKTLVKFIQGVKFTNILHTFFSNYCWDFVIFWCKEIAAKPAFKCWRNWLQTAGNGICVSATRSLPGKLLKFQSWDKSYKDSGLSAFVDLSLIDTLTFLTNLALTFVI